MNYLQTLREEYAAANRWRLQGDVAQATAIRFLGISARIALLILLFLPFSAAKMPWLAASLILAAAGTAWRCRQLASLGHYASALQRYGWVLLLLIVLPLLLFGRNLSYCALIVFTIVPTYVTVLGARAALLYVAAFLALAAAFFLAIPLGLDLPLLFPLHTPMQIATVLYAALAIVVPMVSVLSGVYQERARADRALRDRQAAEQSLQVLSDSLAQRLSQTETLLRSALEVIGEAFVIFDPQDRLVFCNEEYRKVYAKAAPMIAVGRSFAEILRCGADNGLFPDALG